MPYRVRYHSEAKKELDKCIKTYEPTPLPKRIKQWIDELAEEAEAKEWFLSTDLSKLLEVSDEIEQLVRNWPNVWQRFWDAPFLEKLKATLIVVGKWQPPYEARGAVRVFTLYTSDNEVTILYLVNHAKREIVIMAFDGLPMQGYE